MEQSTDFKEQAICRMNESMEKIQQCLHDFPEDKLWERPNDSLISVANQILHLKGNITQYIMAGLAEKPDLRQRDQEFETRSGLDKPDLLRIITSTIHEACSVIKECTDENLSKSREVQGFRLTGLGIILHVVEHLSYHTGQIIFWTKQLLDKDMGFYADIDLNAKNE